MQAIATQPAITIPVDGLKSALPLLKRQVTKSSLKNILLEFSLGMVHLTTCDGDNMARYSIRTEHCPSSDAGRRIMASRWLRNASQICLPFADFESAVKSADKETDIAVSESGHNVELEYTSHGIQITSTAESLPPDTVWILDGPESADDEVESFSASASSILTAIDTAVFASTDQTRYILNSVHLGLHDNHFMWVATDGRRLAAIESGLTTGPAGRTIPTSSIFFHPAWKTLAKSISTFECQWYKKKDWEFLSITAGPITTIIKLPTGNYPNYKQVIPRYKSPAILDIAACRDAYQNILELSIKKLKNNRHLSTGISIDATGTAKVQIAGEKRWLNLTGSAVRNPRELTIRFNPELFRDAVTRGFTEIALEDSILPGLARKPGSASLYVLMPMRVE